MSWQGLEEEEEAEQYSDEEPPAAVAATETQPPAPSCPTEGQAEEIEAAEGEEEEVQKEDDGPSKDESKLEEKGNLAGERQSGDGQVRQRWML